MANDPPKLSLNPPYPTAPDENPRPKKRRRRTVPEPPQHEDAAAVLPEEMVAGLLNRGIAQICKSCGFTGATPVAQERLRQLAEDYYLQMLHTVHRFALAQRRTRPTPVDFEDMLNQEMPNHTKISLSDLEKEMKRMPNRTSTFPLEPPPPPPPPPPDLSALLGPELDGAMDRRKYLDPHFPPFPSRHTYTETPVYAERPTEPRLIRERATAEARLAENALRKLLAVSSTKKENAAYDGKEGEGTKRKERDMAWKKAFEQLGQSEKKVNGIHPNSADSGYETATASFGINKGKAKEGKEGNDDGYLEVLVNANSQFWRSGGGTKRRRGSQSI